MKVGDLVRVKEDIIKLLPFRLRIHGYLWIVESIGAEHLMSIRAKSLATGEVRPWKKYHLEVADESR